VNAQKTIVLAGCGHAHMQVLLRKIHSQLYENTRLIVISPYSRVIYSGMLPGWLAGHYSESELTAHLEPIIRAAGAVWVQDNVVHIDALTKQITTSHHGEFSYDLLSLNLGANIKPPRGIELIEQSRLLPLRPIESFLSDYPVWSRNFKRIDVIGGGAAGAEVAASIQYAGKHTVRWWAGETPLSNYSARLRNSVFEQLRQLGVQTHFARWTPNSDDSKAGLVLTTGPTPAMHAHNLPVDKQGFFATDDTLAVLNQHQHVFAVGDCATVIKPLVDGATLSLPKSGVYAIRGGQFLADQLSRVIHQQALVPWHAQKNSLNLLALGKKYAIASWGEYSVHSRLAWALKNYIDIKFMRTLRIPTTAKQ
jgi:NADH dehydrogenase FAD-containing subunit